MYRLSDRNHVLYQLTNTVTGEIYVGLTVATRRAYKASVTKRFSSHCSRAANETREWNLCRSIRMHSPKAFQIKILSVVRGRAAAEREETRLIAELEPALNTAKKISRGAGANILKRVIEYMSCQPFNESREQAMDLLNLAIEECFAAEPVPFAPRCDADFDCLCKCGHSYDNHTWDEDGAGACEYVTCHCKCFRIAFPDSGNGENVR